MKVAIVHDYIKEYGGAERVLEVFHEIWPDAPVFTSVFLPDYLGPHRVRFEKIKINTSVFQNLPLKNKLISPLRLFSGVIFGKLDLSKYDLVMVSATGAYIPNLIIRNPSSLHICYCHTPPRYLYGYPTARNWKKTLIGRITGEIINHKLRLTDYTAAQRPDLYIANSNETRRRINKFYRREATVIYPPVSMADSTSPDSVGIRGASEKYYLAGGRLARAKHIDLVIKAANKLKFKLVIFGKAFAGYDRELHALAGPTVYFAGEVGEEKLKDLYRNCQALIYPSEFEDFGIMPVEAQAWGKAVVAFRQGGVTESIIEGKTGIFFETLSVESLCTAIIKLGKSNIKKEDCILSAKRFTKEKFKREIIKFVETRLRPD